MDTLAAFADEGNPNQAWETGKEMLLEANRSIQDRLSF
jgi:hypothetical protein